MVKLKLILKNHLSLLLDFFVWGLIVAGLIAICFKDISPFIGGGVAAIGGVFEFVRRVFDGFKIKKSQEFLAILDKKFELSKEIENREKQAIKQLTKKVKAEAKKEKHEDKIKDILN